MVHSAATPLHIFGVSLIGATSQNATRLALSVIWLIVITALGRGLRWVAFHLAHKRVSFWLRQAVSIIGAVLLIAGLLSIWFNDPKQIATALGLVTAGVAFALQRVITAIAGYFVILRGNTFNVGDRIVMGGVRGDVIALNFMQTTILEMGQTDDEQSDKPSMWVHSRQYTGRLVTVTNAKVFDEPIYNYSRELPYFWEEMHLPVPYDSDHARAEAILLAAARRHTQKVQELSEDERRRLEERYELAELEAQPKVYYRLTDNWIALTVRIFTTTHGTRARKDAMSREILAEMTRAGLQVASGTYAIVQFPKVKVELQPPQADASESHDVA